MSGAFENLMTAEELVDSVNGALLDGFRGGFVFTSVVTDSRFVSSGALFVPLIGEKQDGHAFIEQAIAKGASAVFVARAAYEADAKKYAAAAQTHSGTAFIVVENTLRALQNAAMRYVQKFPALIKVGVTGSSGKTTTKEMIVSVLSRKYKVIASEGNFNSETGLPLSVFKIRPEHEAGVFELGMNRANEIGEIAAVLKPRYAVITNIGTAHIGILGSRENIAAEKRKIFDYIPKDGAAFVPAGDDFADFLAQNVRGAVVKYGESVEEKISGVRFVRDEGLNGTLFEVGGVLVRLPLPGVYNFRNALSAAALAKTLGLSASEIKEGLESLSCIAGRMETLDMRLKNGAAVTVIKDCYNANPESMRGAIDFAVSLKTAGKKIYALGDMLELGDSSKPEHAKIGALTADAKPYAAVFVGAEMSAAYKAACEEGCENVFYIDSASDGAIKLLSERLLSCADKGSVILLKASRGIALERVIPLIEENPSAEKGDE
ncbi:MAG: UDP-N-acetylmuramoyl-tripeptide--D-alanyl-D-alanine ligase [Treponema sp.]